MGRISLWRPSPTTASLPWLHRDLWEKRFGRAKMLLQIRSLTPGWMSLLSDLPYKPKPSAKCGCNSPAASKAHGQTPLPPPPQQKSREKRWGCFCALDIGPGVAKQAVPSGSGDSFLDFAQKDTTPAYLTSNTNVSMGKKQSDRKWVSQRR